MLSVSTPLADISSSDIVDTAVDSVRDWASPFSESVESNDVSCVEVKNWVDMICLEKDVNSISDGIMEFIVPSKDITYEFVFTRLRSDESIVGVASIVGCRGVVPFEN